MAESYSNLSRAISPFPTMFSKGLFPRGIKWCHCVGMGERIILPLCPVDVHLSKKIYHLWILMAFVRDKFNTVFCTKSKEVISP